MKIMKLVTFILIAFLLVGCDETTVEVTRLELVEELEEFYVLEDFDITDLSVKVFYADETQEILPIDLSMISSEDQEKLQTGGRHTIYIRVENMVLTLTIQIEDRFYSVSFLDPLATEQEIPQLDNIRHGEVITLPLLEKERYNFLGWAIENSSPLEMFDATQGVESDLVLVAQYEILSYLVTFKDEDGTVLKEAAVDYLTAAIPPSEPSKVGYTFVGWDKEFDAITGDLEVIAVYEINTYSVSFITNQSTSLPSLEGIEHGDTIDLPTLQKLGSIFLGWYLDAEYQNEFTNTQEVTTNITLYAKWQIEYYSVNEVKERIDQNASGVSVEFVGVVIGFDSMGYAHVADETGSIYVRAKHAQLYLGNQVRITGIGFVYMGTASYPEYTRQIQETGILISAFYTRSITPKEVMQITSQDLLVDAQTDYKNSLIHGNLVQVRGWVQAGNTRFTFYLLDNQGNQIATIHHYSTNFNNTIDFPSLNIFLGLDGKEIIMTAIVYRFYTDEMLWTLQCIGIENEVIVVDESNQEFFELSILTVNDLHGYITQDEYGRNGFSNMSYLINQIRDSSLLDNVILMGNGDMFQGTGISNITQGRAVLEVMNMIGFDAMGVGNHEFDWGIEVILDYFDGDPSNGEADFPLLNANIFLVSDNSLLGIMHGNVFEYTIVEREGVLVGIISYIGDVYSSIAYNQVKDYYFDLNIRDSVETIATHLKEAGVDIVVVSIHGGDSRGYQNYLYNNQIASIQDQNGKYLVDVVFNGHTHSTQSGTISRANGNPLIVLQAGGNNSAFGEVVLSIHTDTKEVTSYSYRIISVASAGSNYDAAIESYIQDTLNTLGNEALVIAGDNVFSRDDLLPWSLMVMEVASNADVTITNTGSIRSTGNIRSGDPVSILQMYEISPFDNTIMIMEITYSQMYSLLQSSAITYRVRDGLGALQWNQTYTVAVNSYVYYFSQLDGVRSTQDIDQGIIIRDFLIEDLRIKGEQTEYFRPVSNPYASIEYITPLFFGAYIEDLGVLQ